jgi:hypothetical protein
MVIELWRDLIGCKSQENRVGAVPVRTKKICSLIRNETESKGNEWIRTRERCLSYRSLQCHVHDLNFCTSVPKSKTNLSFKKT